MANNNESTVIFDEEGGLRENNSKSIVIFCPEREVDGIYRK